MKLQDIESNEHITIYRDAISDHIGRDITDDSWENIKESIWNKVDDIVIEHWD